MNLSAVLNEALNTYAALRPEQIELRPGQILQGTIIKLLPDQIATVQLGGVLITARLEASLEEGQKVWLQVQPEHNPITLRLIAKPESANTSSNLPAGPSLGELAKAVQVPLNKEQITFLQSLVEQKVPLTTDLMQKLSGMIKQFGATAELAQAIEVISKRQLPLTNDTISAIRAFQKNENYTNQIDRILQQLTEYTQQHQDNHTIANGSEHSALNNLTQQLLKSKESIQTLDQHINTLFDTHFDPQISTQMNVQSPLQEPPNAFLKAEQLITGLFQQLGLQHEQQILQQTASGRPDTVQHLTNLKAAILQLLQGPEADHLPQPLKHGLDQLADHITGQQLMVTDNNATAAFVQFSLQIPLSGLQQGQNAFIHIESRKKGNKSIDQENCRLFFYLTMQHLGETALDVSIVNKILSVTFYNDQSWVPTLVQQLRGDLEKRLLEHGYILSNFKFVPLPEKTQPFIQSPPDSMTNYKGVDLRI